MRILKTEELKRVHGGGSGGCSSKSGSKSKSSKGGSKSKSSKGGSKSKSKSKSGHHC